MPHCFFLHLLFLFLIPIPIVVHPQIVYNPYSQGECANKGDGTDTTRCPSCESCTLPPIIFVHGFLASKMHLDQTGPVSYPADLTICEEILTLPIIGQIPGLIPILFGQKFSMKGWINPVLAFGNATVPNPANLQACLLYLMELEYDTAIKKYSNRTNVDTTFEARQPFGSNCPTYCAATDSGEPGGCKVSTAAKSEEAYFNNLIEGCLAKIGYVRRCNVFSAPYDWRLTTDLEQMNAFYDKLTNLIESAYNKNCKRKAIIIAHSMGNLVLNHYLNQRMSETWQQKYLKSTVNMAAPYGGTTISVEQFLSGNAGRLFPGLSLVVSPRAIRTFIRTLASLAALLPNILALPPAPTRLLATVCSPSTCTDYTVANLRALLELAGLGHIYDRYLALSQAIQPQKFTEMYCVYSCKLGSTPVYFNYSKGIDQPPTFTKMGGGDTLVNCESLRVCRKWKNDGNEKVKQVVEYTEPTHAGIFSYGPFCKFIKDLLKPGTT